MLCLCWSFRISPARFGCVDWGVGCEIPQETTAVTTKGVLAQRHSFPRSSIEGWRLQPAGGGPAWRPVGGACSPWGLSVDLAYWWLKLKRWLRPCRLDGTLTRRLGRRELASHMSCSKVKHTIMGTSTEFSICEAGRWPVVFSSWLDLAVWLAHSWMFESWMPTRLLAGDWISEHYMWQS